MRKRDAATYRPFPTTQWSLVDRAASGAGSPTRQALEELLRLYIPALRFHLVADRRIEPDRADDLLQGFLATKVLDQGLFARADRLRGRFRNLLLASLHQHVVTEFRRERAAKRMPAGGVAEFSDGLDLVDDRQDATAGFNVAWAKQVLAEAVRRTRDECEGSGRAELWGVFDGRVLAPGRGDEPLDYLEIVRQFNLASPVQASNLLMTAKRMFVRHLRAVVSEYAGADADVEEEIRDLHAALATAPS